MRAPVLASGNARLAPDRRAERPALLDVAFVLPMVLACLVDLPRDAAVAGTSVLGVLTMAQAAAMLLAVLLGRSYPRRVLVALLPWAAFLAWAATRTALANIDLAAAQNGVVYLLFGTCVLLGGMVASRSVDRACALMQRGINGVDVVGWTLTFASALWYGLPRDGVEWLVGARPMALLGLVALSWHLAGWVTHRRNAGIRAAIWILAILVTQSRMATAVALIQAAAVALLHLRFEPRRFLFRMALLAPAAVVASAALFVMAPGVAERFLTADNNLIEVGGFSVSTSGRSNLWPAIIESAEQHPLVGWGLGSSQRVTASLFAPLEHPHSDYLRVWHDLGLVGLLLFVVATVGWAQRLFRDALAALRLHAPDGQLMLPLAGGLAMVGLLLAAITDNAVVYPFVMAPLGLTVGAGLAARRRR